MITNPRFDIDHHDFQMASNITFFGFCWSKMANQKIFETCSLIYFSSKKKNSFKMLNKHVIDIMKLRVHNLVKLFFITYFVLKISKVKPTYLLLES